MREFRNNIWPHVAAVLVILLGVVTAGAGWGVNHGLMFTVMGGVMLCSQSMTALPRWAWGLAALVAVLSLSAFTPLAWGGGMSGWRVALEELGVNTGPLKVVQAHQALEQWALMVLGGGVALWLGGRRSSSPLVPALTLVVGVAVYALVSRVQMEAAGNFGFFPNRNHTATLLAMASLVGLGCCAEYVKEGRRILVVVAVLATALVLWALMAWSISRAGFVLLLVGGLLWLPLLGRRYMSHRVANVLTTMVLLAIIALTAFEGKLSERLMSSGTIATVKVAERQVAETDGASSSLEEIDFRIPTWMDTVSCLKSEWVRGLGAGQFRYVFPQYRVKTASEGYRRSIHPESDWMWVATEVGLPAMTVLAGLVAGLAWFCWKRSTAVRSFKAVRLGCLVGSLLLLVHSGFDVPAHRLSLLWLAALLMGMALPAQGRRCNANLTLRMKILGGVVLVAGAWLLAASVGLAPTLANEAAPRARAMAERLYQQDSALVEAAELDGHSLDELDDALLVEAIQVLEAVELAAPLDPEVWKMRADLALQFDNRIGAARRAHTIVRTLLPNAVEIPLNQAESWGTLDPETTAGLWREALRRSAALQALSDKAQGRHRQTVSRIEGFARRSPVLKELAESVLHQDIDK